MRKIYKRHCSFTVLYEANQSQKVAISLERPSRDKNYQCQQDDYPSDISHAIELTKIRLYWYKFSLFWWTDCC